MLWSATGPYSASPNGLSGRPYRIPRRSNINQSDLEKNALASGQPPVLRYTHAGFCASRWRYAPFSGKMRCGARGRLASLGAVPCGGCMVRSACAFFLCSKCCCYPGSSTRSAAMFVLSAGTFQVSLDNHLFQVYTLTFHPTSPSTGPGTTHSNIAPMLFLM